MRAHDQLVRRSPLPEEGRQLCEETMHRPGLDGGFEQGVQFIVERPRPLHRRDVLRHAGQIDGPVAGDIERARQVCGEITDSVEAEHGDDPSGHKGGDNLCVVVQFGATAARCSDAGLVAQDLRLQALQLGPGFDTQLFDELGARRLIRVKGLCLAAGAVKGENLLAAERLAKRMLGDERLELAHDVTVPAELEIGLDPFLESVDSKLLETADLRLGELLEGELRERRASPERERILDLLAALGQL